MATTKTTRRRGPVGWLIGPLVALSLISGTQVDAQRPQTQVLDAASIIEHLSNSLADGRRELKGHLSRLGFQQELDAMRSLEGSQLYSFSSETTIETLYRRASATSPDEGNRFLAVLYNDAKRRSAAIAVDPAFAALRELPPERLAAPIRFAAPSLALSQRVPLPPAADAAIDILADTYSGRSLAKMRATMVRHLRKPDFDSRAFDRALADASNTRDALRRIIAAGTPPPAATEALRNVLRDTVRTTAALRVDPDTLNVIEALSRDLPTELDRYRQAEDTLTSRQRQAVEARAAAGPSKVVPASSTDVLDNMRRPANRDPLAPVHQTAAAGGNGTSAAHTDALTRAYSDYTSRTFTPRTPEPSGNVFRPAPATPRVTVRPPTPTPRVYSRAIVSVRAARGIAMGGRVSSTVRNRPTRAFWVANRNDDRFGRMFVSFEGTAGEPAVVAASRVLFADSFYAARSMLWDPHDKEATFVEGEILVLMSMDPEGAVALEARETFAAKSSTLRVQAMTAGTDEEKEAVKARLRALILEGQRLPRAIVLHPSIVGRELGWTAARVDFWFNQMALLSKEASAINGGRPMPSTFLALPISQAQTWQFYEKDSTVQLGRGEGSTQRLIVSSKTDRDTAPSDRSHFRVSLFSLEGRTEESAESLPELEENVQPLLDWLSTNHHDFMRLNDLSEAFSILRWLAPARVPITILDLDGDEKRVVTPDRVIIGEGPGAKPRAPQPWPRQGSPSK